MAKDPIVQAVKKKMETRSAQGMAKFGGSAEERQ